MRWINTSGCLTSIRFSANAGSVGDVHGPVQEVPRKISGRQRRGRPSRCPFGGARSHQARRPGAAPSRAWRDGEQRALHRGAAGRDDAGSVCRGVHRGICRRSRFHGFLCQAGLHQRQAVGEGVAGRGRRRAAGGRGFRPVRHGPGGARQCRICFGQPDGAAACRPLPRRGVRGCAGQSSRQDGLRRGARILRQ